jgi:hypothetical protein
VDVAGSFWSIENNWSLNEAVLTDGIFSYNMKALFATGATLVTHELPMALNDKPEVQQEQTAEEQDSKDNDSKDKDSKHNNNSKDNDTNIDRNITAETQDQEKHTTVTPTNADSEISRIAQQDTGDHQDENQQRLHVDLPCHLHCLKLFCRVGSIVATV